MHYKQNSKGNKLVIWFWYRNELRWISSFGTGNSFFLKKGCCSATYSWHQTHLRTKAVPSLASSTARRLVTLMNNMAALPKSVCMAGGIYISLLQRVTAVAAQDPEPMGGKHTQGAICSGKSKSCKVSRGRRCPAAPGLWWTDAQIQAGATICSPACLAIV